jgi:hypothetical protein
MADTLVARWKASPYRITMNRTDMVWGSNAVILNQAMMLVQAYRIKAQPAYLDAAQSSLDYVLGRNAVGISFVTGFGAQSPQHPHHRPSEADRIAAPIPRFDRWRAEPRPARPQRLCRAGLPIRAAGPVLPSRGRNGRVPLVSTGDSDSPSISLKPSSSWRRQAFVVLPYQ